jgi:hypothetical protein
MKVLKRILLAALLIITTTQTVFIVLVLNSWDLREELKTHVATINELKKLRHIIEQKGSDYSERAIAIQLAINAVKLEKLVSENESSIPRKQRDFVLQVAESALREK